MSALAQTTPARIARRIRLETERLEFGMYVAELDRPWMDTPFQVEGFLIDDPAEVDALREHCSYVYIDPSLSDPSVVARIRNAAMHEPVAARRPAGAGSGRERAAAGRTRPDARSIERFRRFLQRVELDDEIPARERTLIRRAGMRLRRWISSATPSSGGSEEMALADLGERLGRTGLERVDYPRALGFDEALPVARVAVNRLADAAESVFAAVGRQSGADIRAAAAAVAVAADSVIANPDAPFCAIHALTGREPMIRQSVFTCLSLLALGRSIGLPIAELEAAGLAGLLADVGKMRLPRALLGKPGMLSANEYALAREHVRMGLEALRRSGPLATEVEELIAQHHERLDGSGYPRGLDGSDIGFWGRIGAIADCYGALVSPRAYAEALPPQEAMACLYEWAGTSFDAALVEQLVYALGPFPAGSLVELTSGEVAMVLSARRPGGAPPTVKVLLDPHHQPLEPAPVIDLGCGEAVSVERLRIKRGLPASDALASRAWRT